MISPVDIPKERVRFAVRFVGLGLVFSFVVFFFWQHPPASLLMLVLAAVLAWIRPSIAIALLPLTFPYYLDLKPLTPSGFPAFSLIELGLFICLGVVVLRNVVLPKERLASREWVRYLWGKSRLFLLPALVFLIGASLATLVSPDLHESVRAYREEIIEPLLYFLLILRYLQTRDDVARAVGALVFSALIAAVMGIIQGVFHITSDLLYVDATTFRVNGPYGSPNNLAFLLDRTLPILLALALVGLVRRPGDGARAFRIPWRDPLRWTCLVLMIPLFWALYWTGSRGAEVALAVVFSLLFIFEIRNWIVLMVVVGVGGAGAFLLRSRLLGFLDASGHGILSERLLLWKAGLLMIRDHFLLGTGPDSFNSLYAPTSPSSYALKALDGQAFPAAYNPHLSHPHNFFLDFWISTGLLGLVAFFWLLGAFMLLARRVYCLCTPLWDGPLLQRLLVGIVGSIIATLVHGLVDNSYFVPDLAMMFWFFIGILLVLQRMVAHEQRLLRQRFGAPGLSTKVTGMSINR